VPEGKHFWVTELAIATVEALEEPLAHACALETRTFSFVSTRRISQGASSPSHESTELLPLRNGQARVSDEEWALIEPKLGPVLGRRQIHDRREMLNGILSKLCTGRPWRDIEYTVGTFVNASRQYASWRATGKWDAVVEVITARRSTVLDETNQGSSTHGLASRLEKLTEADWIELLAACPRPKVHRKYNYRDTVLQILSHELAGRPWSKDIHAGKSFEHEAAALHSRWRKNGVLARLVAAVTKTTAWCATPEITRPS
jgi:transposase